MVIALLILLPFLTPVSLGGGNGAGGGSGPGGGAGGGGGSSSSGTSSNSAMSGNGNNNGNVAGSGVGIGDTASLASRVVHTKYGAVSGVIVHLDGRNLDPVEAFKGIPYASPPVGSLRFMPPVTGALWSGVKKADRYGRRKKSQFSLHIIYLFKHISYKFC